MTALATKRGLGPRSYEFDKGPSGPEGPPIVNPAGALHSSSTQRWVALTAASYSNVETQLVKSVAVQPPLSDQGGGARTAAATGPSAQRPESTTWSSIRPYTTKSTLGTQGIGRTELLADQGAKADEPTWEER